MTTGPISLTGSAAAAQDPLAGGDWAGARNYVRRDAGAEPGAPASAPAAPAATPAAADMPAQQGLVPTVLELPGDLLNLVFGKPAATGPAATMERGIPGSAAGPPASAPGATGNPTGARSYIGRDPAAAAPAASGPAPAAAGPAAPAAASARPSVTASPNHQGLVQTVLDVPGNLLSRLSGPQPGAVTTSRPGPAPSGPGGGEIPAGTRNYIGRDPAAAAAASPATPAAAAAGPPATAPANQPGLVQKVLELPGNLLSRVSGPQPVTAAAPKPAAMTAQPEPKMGTTTMATAPIGPSGPPATRVLGSENWASARNYIGPDTGPVAPSPAAAAHSAAPATPPGL